MPEENSRLVVRKVIPASREEVFAAWTDPESIKLWMCPGDTAWTDAELDVRVGGAYRIVMKGGREDVEHTGEYRLVDPPSKLVFTWISKYTGNQPTLVTVELFERGGHCELVLTHEGFSTSAAVKQHQGGWNQIADKLAGHFAKASERSAGAPA
jgi:uncharacterized protein YndB with AHSA1/START domain